jgi:WD40 repeat protein/DNA-binding SARP family transcriptional activator
MAHLHLSLLGPFQVTRDGKPVTDFKSDKVRALLAYLAAEAGRPHRRETLAGLLWPDWPDREARSNLRYTLFDLRRAIGDREAEPPFLHIIHDTLQFNVASDHWLDVAEFATLIGSGERPTLERAVALYRGSFLEGFSVVDAAPFEEWAVLKREHLGREMLAALHRLAAAHEALGEYDSAAAYARRQVDLEPWNEEAHQDLMRLLALRGQRSAALAQYETCRRLLAEELGVDPGRETVALYESIRDGTLLPPSHARVAIEEAPASGEPPFKGLQYFDVDDVHLFFGREELTARLVEHLRQHRFLAVVGASGSGKSSVVRAGLIPALTGQAEDKQAHQEDPRVRGVAVHLITPTAHPLAALATRLTRDVESVTAAATLTDDLARDPRALSLYLSRARQLRGVSPVLLVVDQFEELFSLCHDAAERQAFVDNVVAAVQMAGASEIPDVSIVIALRADFYAHCAQFAGLRELLARHQVYIGAMSRDELRRAIQEPARRNGWELEAGLADLILEDAGDEPGALPLLSHALLETWRRRRGRRLTVAGYLKAGGVRGAIARTAESTFQRLSPEQQAIAQSIFLGLTELGEGTQDTRRRVLFSELIPRPEDAPAAEGVLRRLVEARLVTTSEAGVEVAHEALIREWPALRQWLDENREGLRLHRRITEAAREWERLERDPGTLYRGVRLGRALEWAKAHGPDLTPLERAFLDASQAMAEQRAAEHEARRQRELEAARKLAEAEGRRAEDQARAAARLRRRAFLLASASILAVVLAAVAFLAFRQASQNAETAQAASTWAVGQQAAAETARALEAAQRATAEAEGWARATQQAVAKQERAKADLRAQEAYARELSQAAEANLARDPELSMLLALEAISVSQAADIPASLQLQDILHRAMQASRARLTIAHPGGAFGIDVSPDETLLATAGIDGVVRIWDAQTGRSVQTLTGHTAAVEDVVFSPDGERLASAGDDATARVWDLASGDAVLTLTGHSAPIGFIAYSPDGTRLATAGDDNRVLLWEVSRPAASQILLELPGQTGQLRFSPDGSRLVTTAVEDGKSRVWDTLTGQEVLVLPYAYGSGALAFSPDGARLAVEGPEMGQVTLFDVTSGAPLTTLCCHTARVGTIDFSPDGSMIATAGQEGVARIWDAGSGRLLIELSGQMGPVDDLVFSPECAEPPQAPFPGCGRYLYTASRDGTITKWDVSPAGNRDLLTARSMNALFAPDGQRAELINLSPLNQLVVQTWRVGPGSEPEPLDTYAHPPMPGPIIGGDVAVLPEKTVAVVASMDGSVQTWEVGNPQSLISYTVPISASENVVRPIIVPDGLRLVTSAEPNATQIWDVVTGKALFSVPVQEAVAISPDGRLLAGGDVDGMVSVWDTTDGEMLRTIAAHPTVVMGIAFSPDGKRLATGSLDTTARVWDLSTEMELFTLGHTSSALSPVFSPDGNRLAVNQGDGSLYLWDVEPGSPTAGQLLFRFTGLDEYATFNGFSPDGRIVFAGSYFGEKIRLYALPVENLVSLASSRLTRWWTQEECRIYLHAETCPAVP